MILTNTITETRKKLHAQLCYQLFITPLHLPLEKKYRCFARRACEYFEDKRSQVMHSYQPRHYVVHHFAQSLQKNPKKVLLVHGWMSRGAYMAKITHALHKAGYEVFVPDLPAHGEAKGVRLQWTEAVAILRNIINEFGPFHSLIGHSFGGSMILNTLNVSGQLPQWQLNTLPERVILMASPTRMSSPVNQLARKFKLNSAGYLYLKQLIECNAEIDPKRIRLQRFINQDIDIPFLCLHGTLDQTVDIQESIVFCQKYKHGELQIIEDIDHVDILMDKRVDERILEFLDDHNDTYLKEHEQNFIFANQVNNHSINLYS